MTEEERFINCLRSIKASKSINPHDLKDMSEEDQELIHRLFQENLVEGSLVMLTEINSEEDLKAIKSRLKDIKKFDSINWRFLIKYAAVFIGVLFSVYHLWTKDIDQSEPNYSDQYVQLKMGDESVLFIDQKESKEIISASGVLVGKQEGSNLIYLPNSEIEQLLYNELHIPNGKVFNLELSDGTLVTLNSGTKIRFPVKFIEGMKREVFINGEAFFDVAKDLDHPFIVNTDDIVVEVLGTVFNISSYEEDTEISTILLEGSVNMHNINSSSDQVILKPGMKGSWKRDDKSIGIQKVDTELYTGWLQGELIFKNSSFKTIAKTLERKYNVSIDNRNKILSEKELTASFNINIESIEEVLKLISAIHPFEYSIKNNHIRIWANTNN
ncbi:FecR family protein [Flavobacteriaceae bacterium MAR_2010_188]|nr:FecR family protein [Flavobacteriaceae bacterium MAR_2010_188]